MFVLFSRIQSPIKPESDHNHALGQHYARVSLMNSHPLLRDRSVGIISFRWFNLINMQGMFDWLELSAN